jgi:hypothetical protein
MHEEWTDELSDYLDGELPASERAALDAHLRGCHACAAVLEELKEVVTRAQALPSRAPQIDLWDGVAARTEMIARPRRFEFTLPQLAAAAALLMAISGTLAVRLAAPAAAPGTAGPAATSITERATTSIPLLPETPAFDAAPIGLADAQYDAAVVDLEKALKQGRGRLDSATIAIVEHNLQIIDQAIAQAREALEADPANTYLSGHLVEARRRKLDLLRRAAALGETD